MLSIKAERLLSGVSVEGICPLNGTNVSSNQYSTNIETPMMACVFLEVVTNKIAFIKNTIDMRCNTPGIRIVVNSKFGIKLRKTPIANNIKLRFNTLIKRLYVRPELASLFIENDKETPMINRNKGNTRSVGVTPFQAECLKGKVRQGTA